MIAVTAPAVDPLLGIDASTAAADEVDRYCDGLGDTVLVRAFDSAARSLPACK